MTKKVISILFVTCILSACNSNKIKQTNNKMDKTNLYKAVLVFNLTKGSADEELRRSNEETSFPNMLAKQQGFIEMELVKINEEKTMSIQTWETEQDWWTALETVKNIREKSGQDSTRENILVSREFLNGYIKVRKTRKQSDETNNSIKTTETKSSDLTNSNKAFLETLISNRHPLTDYPERVTEDFVVYLSAPLPFAGKYLGLNEYYALVPQLLEYYDYSKIKLLGVYADDYIVFVSIQIGLKQSEINLILCEQFTFKEDRIKDLRTFVFN